MFSRNGYRAEPLNPSCKWRVGIPKGWLEGNKLVIFRKMDLSEIRKFLEKRTGISTLEEQEVMVIEQQI